MAVIINNLKCFLLFIHIGNNSAHFFNLSFQFLNMIFKLFFLFKIPFNIGAEITNQIMLTIKFFFLFKLDI